MSDHLIRGRASGALIASSAGQDPAQTSSPGSLVGSSGLVYRPLRQLGEGGMARVFLACAQGSAGFSKLVVLKQMRRYLDGSEFRAMFLQEARLSARLNHPNLVQVYEVVDNQDAPYLVMEYLEGKPLSELRRLPAVTREMTLTVLSEALVGLHHAHEMSDYDGSLLHIVHRDISPHNIFVTYDGAVKVLDFGVAKTSANAGHTRNGEVRGKLAYMAPEQFLGEEVDRRADVFAMGAVLWELTLGTPFWGSADQGVMIQRLATGNIPRPDPGANLDPELEAIIVRATAAAPADRYATALEMQQALASYRAGLSQVYTPRDVGMALASAFQAERDADRAAVREVLSAPWPGANDEERPTDVPVEPVVDAARPVAVRAASRSWTWVLLAFSVAVVAAFAAVSILKRGQAEPPPAASPVAPKPAAQPVEASEPAAVGASAPPAGPAGSAEAPPHVEKPARVRAPRPYAGKPAKSAPVAPAGQPSARIRCDTPYYFKDGIKTFRPECL